MTQLTLTQNIESVAQQQTDSQPETPDQPPTSNERGTPPRLIEGLVKTNNGLFAADLASGAETQPIGDIRFDKEDNSLRQSWNPADHPDRQSTTDKPVTPRSGYLNPPFGDIISKFAEKVDEEMRKNSLDYLIFLCSARALSNDWFHDHIMPHAEFLCLPHGPNGRLRFTDPDGNIMGSPGFPTVMLSLGETPPQFVEFFNREGRCFELIEQQTVQEDLYELITNSVHQTKDNPGLISTQYADDEPILNNVGRGSRLELRVGDSMVGYPDTKLQNQTVTVTVETWTDKGDAWTVTTNLAQEDSPYNEAGYVIISVQKNQPSAFSVSFQIGDDIRWQPLPVANIRTISDRIEW